MAESSFEGKPLVPSKIVVEVFCGNAVEAFHPVFEPRVVGIYMVDVVNAEFVLTKWDLFDLYAL